MQKLRKIEVDSSREQKLKIINFPNGRREVIPPSLVALHSGELAHFLPPSYSPAWKSLVWGSVHGIEIKIQRTKISRKRKCVQEIRTGKLRETMKRRLGGEGVLSKVVLPLINVSIS